VIYLENINQATLFAVASSYYKCLVMASHQIEHLWKFIKNCIPEIVRNNCFNGQIHLFS